RELLYAGIFTLKRYLPHIKHVVGHNEQGKTACPCTSMNRVRKDLTDIELEMEYAKSDNSRLAQIFNFHARYMDLYKKASNNQDKFQAAAQSKLMDIIKIAEDKGYYVP